jgi:putative endonuclease
VAGLGPAIHETVATKLISRRGTREPRRLGLHYDEPTKRHALCGHDDPHVGTTTHLARRAWEHREGIADGFTKKYGLTRLVYAERHDDILAAKQRERNIKHWRRAWKVRLILKGNPDWDDLYDRLA